METSEPNREFERIEELSIDFLNCYVKVERLQIDDKMFKDTISNTSEDFILKDETDTNSPVLKTKQFCEEEIKNHKCQICGETFSVAERLNLHIKCVHEGLKYPQIHDNEGILNIENFRSNYTTILTPKIDNDK